MWGSYKQHASIQVVSRKWMVHGLCFLALYIKFAGCKFAFVTFEDVSEIVWSGVFTWSRSDWKTLYHSIACREFHCDCCVLALKGQYFVAIIWLTPLEINLLSCFTWKSILIAYAASCWKIVSYKISTLMPITNISSQWEFLLFMKVNAYVLRSLQPLCKYKLLYS